MVETLLQKAQRLGIQPAGRPSAGIIKQKTGEAQRAEIEAQKIASPFGQAKESVKALGEITGFTPTGRRIAAAIAPYTEKAEDLPNVVDELVGGVTKERRMGDIGNSLKKMGVSENTAEFIDIALDLPIVSLGLSKSIATALEKEVVKKSPELLKFLAKPLTEFTPDALKNVLKTDISTPIKESVEQGVEKIKGLFDKLRPSEILGKTKSYFARKNVAENLDTSVERLASKIELEEPKTKKIKIVDMSDEEKIIELKNKGYTQKEDDALSKYDEFYEQELKFKKDVHQDMAAAKVGERIGDSYDDVIKQRQKIGKQMADELEKIKDLKTYTIDAKEQFKKELLDSGLRYSEKDDIIIASKISKVTGQDKDLILEYIKELNNLGNRPTIAELDAFLSRVPQEINVFKAKNNITKTTNGERIIKQNLRALRDELSPTKNTEFKPYYDARNDYAELSNFLDEGAGFLGKRTQSGDYAKDASLAKSSVQSLLNNGKKDWLLKLEDLTDYPALDEAVLALQAMKDAGNPMGHSLLELLTKDAKIPTSAVGVAEMITKKSAEFIGKKFIGTPNIQTRRVIKEILQRGGAIPARF